jgi:hypothetical protein
MQTIINFNDIDQGFLDNMKNDFAGKKVKISIELIEKPVNQKEIFKKMEALQKKYPPRIISKDIDLSALANEVNL